MPNPCIRVRIRVEPPSKKPPHPTKGREGLNAREDQRSEISSQRSARTLPVSCLLSPGHSHTLPAVPPSFLPANQHRPEALVRWNHGHQPSIPTAARNRFRRAAPGCLSTETFPGDLSARFGSPSLWASFGLLLPFIAFRTESRRQGEQCQEYCSHRRQQHPPAMFLAIASHIS